MKILIIGLGSIGKRHVNVIRELHPEIEIFAIRSSETAEEVPFVTNLYSLDEISFQPDFIIISNPTNLHAESIISSVKFNCPLFIEKPALHSLNDVDAIQKLLDENNINTYVGCCLRFHKCLEYVKAELSNMPLDSINEVNCYYGSYLPNWRPGTNYTESYSAKKENGGGIHLDSIHELDYVYWLFNKPEVISSSKRKVSQLEIDSVDNANYILEYSDFNVNVTLNYFRPEAKRTLEIVFKDQVWMVDLLKNEVTESGNVLFTSEETIADTYVAQMECFLENLHSSAMMNSFKESMDVLNICLHDKQ